MQYNVIIKGFLLYFILSLFAITGKSQEFSVENLNLKDGLPGSNVFCSVQDSFGFLWIGTSNGLCRYDGYEFEILRLTNKNYEKIDITSLQISPQNHLWIGTLTGDLFCFDLKKERFIQLNYKSANDYVEISTLSFYNDTTLFVGTPWGLVKESLSVGKTDNEIVLHSTLILPDPISSNRNNNHITCLRKHHQDHLLWVGTNSGLFALNLTTESFEQINTQNLRSVRDITLLKNEQTLISFWDHGLLLLDSSNNVIQDHQIEVINQTIGDRRVICVHHEESTFWVGTYQDGLFYFNFESTIPLKKRLYFDPTQIGSIGSNAIKYILKDQSNLIWVGHLDAGGVTKITSEKYHLNYLKATENLNVNSILVRSHNKIWVGTKENGLVLIDRSLDERIPFPSAILSDQYFPYKIIQCIFEDVSGNFWIGTHGDGIHVIPHQIITALESNQIPKHPFVFTIKQKSFPQFNNYISSICQDRNSTFWVGTNQGLFLINASKINQDSGSFSSLSRQFIVHNFFSENLLLRRVNVSNLYLDKNEQLWVCTNNNGIFKVDTRNPNPLKIAHFTRIQNKPNSIQSNKVFACTEDDQNRLWVSSVSGLDVIDLNNLSLKPILTNDQTGNYDLLNLTYDHKGNLWSALSYGILKLDLQDTTQKRYFKSTPYTNFFIGNARSYNPDGTLYLGSRNGVTYFNPDSIHDINTDAPFYISAFKINNTKVKPDELINGRVVLTENINETSAITLKNADHTVSFEIASLDYFNSSSIQYQYLLEGFDSNWTILKTGQHTITFTNLRNGNYILHIRATNSEGVWNEKEILLSIKVLPPFYLSNIAIFLYFLVFAFMLYLFQLFSVMREKDKNKVRIMTLEKLKSEELNNLKLQFFTNISHEFRTPLSLILSPIEVLLNKIADVNIRQQLSIIQRNANRLLFLVNQILDIRKLEAGKIKLSPQCCELNDFSENIFSLFQPVAEKKHISFKIEVSKASIFVNIDPHYMECVLYNILSNAIRYTNKGGTVKMKVFIRSQRACIAISDTGIGIRNEDQSRIFERFYYSSSMSAEWVGAGIGLYFSKSIIELHEGNIEVQSREEVGSTFTITLPRLTDEEVILSKKMTPSHPFIPIEDLEVLPTGTERLDIGSPNIQPGNNEPKEHTIVVVEDNQDLRQFIVDQLQSRYKVFYAENGKLAWDNLQTFQPDLVITDVMMPDMDGLELCQRIKTSETFSHVPVIILSAKNLEEDRVGGYQMGADAYIFKPFKFQYLLLRIENLLRFKSRIKSQLSDNLYVTDNKKVESRDKLFLDKTIALVVENLQNSDFNVDKMYKNLGVSRTNLYRKIKELTNYSVKELVREIRLQHAAQILRNDDVTVNEVAFLVGFRSTPYFSKCFKEKFSMTPHEYNKEHYSPPHSTL